MYPLLTLDGRVAWLIAWIALFGAIGGVVLFLNHEPAKIQQSTSSCLLFPLAVLSLHGFSDPWNVPIVVATGQFPAYAATLVLGNARRRVGSTAISIGVLHLLAALACLAMRSSLAA
jgi:hypothetical protein